MAYDFDCNGNGVMRPREDTIRMGDLIKQRDAAIEVAAKAGLSWFQQALVGLGSFPPGIEGSKPWLFYLLYYRCPLVRSDHEWDERTYRRRNLSCGTLIKEALRRGLIKRVAFGRRPTYVTTARSHVEFQARPNENRAVARAAARAGCVCKVCGQPITAARSTRKYCSTKCRVAAHRAHLPAIMTRNFGR